MKVYTDGSCWPNPGPGGWAAVFVVDGNVVDTLRGRESYTTNNRMELTAVIRALEAVEGHVIVYTDSKYVKDGIESWIKAWKRNGWQTASKKPVKNRDLWQRLDAVQHKATWQWVRGHAGDRFNELADLLAKP